MLLLTNVRKSFREPSGGTLSVLDVERFSAAAGEQLALVGRSGSGKSTLLHVISGIARADSGVVQVDGVDVARLSEAAADRFRAERIGYVFQTFNLLPGFTALENVMLGMTFSGNRGGSARAMELLDRVGLGARASHRPPQLSVGEQQRVAVARALANRPKLMLADEPTANVDAGNQQHVIDLLRDQCRAENVTLILVTHSHDVARQFERIEQLESVNRAMQAT
jgi:putative ABC transport system ATP-binding protein